MSGSNNQSNAQQAPIGSAQPQIMLSGAYDAYQYQIDTGASQLGNHWDEGLTQFQAPPMGTEFDYSYHFGHQPIIPQYLQQTAATSTVKPLNATETDIKDARSAEFSVTAPVAPHTSDLLELKSSTAFESDANIAEHSTAMNQMYDGAWNSYGGYHAMPPADYTPVSSVDPYVGLPPVSTFGNDHAGHTQFCPPASNGINDSAMADHAQFQNGMNPHFGAHYAAMPLSGAMVPVPREKSNGPVSGRYKRRVVTSKQSKSSPAASQPTRCSPLLRLSPDTESGADDKSTRRKAQNNARERVRVQDINSAFEELGKLCSQLNSVPTETVLTKMDILNQAYALITQMEEEVRRRKVIAEMKKKADDDMAKFHDSQDTADVGQSDNH